MNPDKLFDYLDGKLPDHERQALEERLMSNARARREFDVVRRIHASMPANQTRRPLGISEWQSTTEQGQNKFVADGIVTVAKRFLGAGTKGVPNDGEIQVLVEIPANKAAQFKSALTPLPGVKEVNGDVATTNSTERISIILQLTEAK